MSEDPVTDLDYMEEAADHLGRAEQALLNAFTACNDRSVETDISLLQTAMVRHRRELRELIEAAHAIYREQEEEAGKWYKNAYGRVPKQDEAFWRLIVETAEYAYDVKPEVAWCIYASTHRPMSSVWARMDGVYYITPVLKMVVQGVHTWVVATRSLTQEEVDRYELIPCIVVPRQ